jgi:hypothetical protein
MSDDTTDGQDETGQDGTESSAEAADSGLTGADAEAFQRELESARELLEDDTVSALHVGVVRGDRVDTAFAQRADGPREEGLQALTLLATHLRLVAEEAGVGYDTVAADAAQLAHQVEEGTAPPAPEDAEE